MDAAILTRPPLSAAGRSARSDVRGCDHGIDCGRCGYGCRLGAKQSTAKTWLADAAAGGARLHVGVSARRVLVG